MKRIFAISLLLMLLTGMYAVAETAAPDSAAITKFVYVAFNTANNGDMYIVVPVYVKELDCVCFALTKDSLYSCLGEDEVNSVVISNYRDVMSNDDVDAYAMYTGEKAYVNESKNLALIKVKYDTAPEAATVTSALNEGDRGYLCIDNGTDCLTYSYLLGSGNSSTRLFTPENGGIEGAMFTPDGTLMALTAGGRAYSAADFSSLFAENKAASNGGISVVTVYICIIAGIIASGVIAIVLVKMLGRKKLKN